MSDKETVPYEAIPTGEQVLTYFKHAELDNGTTIDVGYQPTHKDGPVFFHRMEHDQPDGTRTRLEFACTVDGVRALMLLYLAHFEAIARGEQCETTTT